MTNLNIQRQQNRDYTRVGDSLEFPFFFGPFDNFQPIETGGFDNDKWILHCEKLFLQFTGQENHKNKFSISFAKQYAKNAAKKVLTSQFNSPLPYSLIKEIKKREYYSLVDVGGGWGDNYLKIRQRGLLKSSRCQYSIIDNEKQRELGQKLFKNEERLSFETDLGDKHFDLCIVIGTLQYIEHWQEFLKQLFDKNVDKIYIFRTPVIENQSSFVAVQSIVPSTLDYKIGEENLWVININELKDVAERIGWKLLLIGKSEDYSPNFMRFPIGFRKVVYQRILLTKN